MQDYEYIDAVSNDIDGTAVSEGSEGDSDYAGDDSPFDESDYESSDDYEELEYDYELAEEPLPLEEVHVAGFNFGGYKISDVGDFIKRKKFQASQGKGSARLFFCSNAFSWPRNDTTCVSSTSFGSKSAQKTKFWVKH